MDNKNVADPVVTGNPQVAADPSLQERNFASLRQARERAEMQVMQEREARVKAEQELEAMKRRPIDDDSDDDEDDSYVDSKKLKRQLSKMEQNIERKAEDRARRIIEEERGKNFMVQLRTEYRDFDEVLSPEAANRLAEANPVLAETILALPNEYEKRKLAYETIKSMGFHKKPEPKASAQDLVNKNMRNPYYYPASQGSAPGNSGDFTEAGKKAAYEKMKSTMRAPLNR